MNYAGKVALVTGATSGIGLAITEALIKQGARVAMVARTASNLEALVQRFGSEQAAAFALDVADRTALKALPARIVATFGALDLVIQNAGLTHRGPFAGIPEDLIASVIDTNLTGPMVLTRACLPHLQAGSHVVFIASLAGMVPLPDEAPYSASKAGLRFFATAIADELKARDIHIGIVSPGPVDTNFFGDAIEEVPNLVFSQPMSTAEEITEAVLRCIKTKSIEIAVPAASGKLATLGYLFPALGQAIRPHLERKGAKAKAAYIAKRMKNT
jgi:short-subunit dehydrogenase